MNKSLAITIVLVTAGFGAGWLLREQTFVEKIEIATSTAATTSTSAPSASAGSAPSASSTP